MQSINPEHSLWDQLVYTPPPGWTNFFNEYYYYMELICENLIEYNNNFVPSVPDLLTFMWKTPLNTVKVIIMADQPYDDIFSDGVTEACGMAYAGRPGRKIPKTLNVIFSELDRQYDGKLRPHLDGDLTKWANQGVLLLNSKFINSELDVGKNANFWKGLVISILKECVKNNPNCILVLWGAKMQEYLKEDVICKGFQDRVLKCGYPSNSNYNNTFTDNNHFLMINVILNALNQPQIDWNTH